MNLQSFASRSLHRLRTVFIEDLKPEHILAGAFLIMALFLYIPHVSQWDSFKWPILIPAAFFWALMLGNRRLIPYRWLAIVAGIFPIVLLLGFLALHVRHQPDSTFNWSYYYVLAGRFLLHMAVVAVGAWIVQHRRISGFTVGQVIRAWLPFVVMALIYENMHDIVVTINPKIMDPMLISWDLKIFGMHHSVWLQRFVTPALNDFFSASYHLYLMYPMVLGFSLYRNANDRNSSFRHFMLAYLYSCYIGFVGYILVPGIGPYYGLGHLYHIPLEGGLLTQLNSYLYHSFSNMRDVFPSLHTANTIVCLVFAFRYRRKLFWIFLAPATSLIISTIYLRYHYTVDVVAGLALGPVACYLGEMTDVAWNWLKKFSNTVSGEILHVKSHSP